MGNNSVPKFIFRLSRFPVYRGSILGRFYCIRDKTGAQNIVKEIKQYQKKRLQHVQRMDTNRIPKQALQYRPKGRRNIGRPKKRWRDQFHFENQGTGNTPNPSGTWWWRWWWWWVLTQQSGLARYRPVASMTTSVQNTNFSYFLS